MGAQTNYPIGTVGSNPTPTTDAPLKGGSYGRPATAVDWARFVHRLLRGRYRITLIIVVVCAAGGALAGWHWTAPAYRADGMVRIASNLPAVIQETDQTRTIPMFDSLMQAQQEMVTSGPVMEEALKNPAWSAHGLGRRKLSVEELASQVKVEVRPKSENLRISCIDQNPAFASTAVASTILAYQKVYVRDHLKLEQQRLGLLQDYRSSLMDRLGVSDATTKPAEAEAQAAAPTPTTAPAAAPVDAVAATVAAPEPAPAVIPTPETIAMTDPGMRHLLDDQDRAQEDLDQATTIYGPQHRTVLRLSITRDAAARRVDEYFQQYIDLHRAVATVVAPARNEPSTQPAAQVPVPAAVVVAPPAPPTAAMQQLMSQLEDVNRRIEILKAESAMPKRFEVVSVGEFAVPIQDMRIKVAGASAGAAGLLALALMLVSGLIRRRYNFCAELTEDFSPRTPFVAAIPELGSGVHPRGSEDAAQCIHHLREAIKQSGKVYAFTSAGVGEGRSSVVLSLALSLSATGARTLVIDADLLSQGISRKLKLESAPGFFQALSGGGYTEDFLHMSRGGITIMPVGHALRSEALCIGEAAMVGFVQQLRQRFDAILIDAGLMSCVETAVVARQADGTVLVVARGQEQHAVRSGLTKLEQLKLNVLGTVFNRAEKRDFYRSIHRAPIEATDPDHAKYPRRWRAVGRSCRRWRYRSERTSRSFRPTKALRRRRTLRNNSHRSRAMKCKTRPLPSRWIHRTDSRA